MSKELFAKILCAFLGISYRMLILPHGKRRVITRLTFVTERNERTCLQVDFKQNYLKNGRAHVISIFYGKPNSFKESRSLI